MSEPRSENITWAHSQVDVTKRADILGHGAATLWFTGLSGSGKSTLATAVESALADLEVLAYVLDGDNIRFGLNRDLGFSPEDRAENIRRVGEVCRLMHDAGLIVLTAFISPYLSDRRDVRGLHPDGGFHEIHVETPIEVCEARDVKGLYAKARAGEIPDFSGVSAPYEAPTSPELRIDTSDRSLDACVGEVISYLRATGTIS